MHQTASTNISTISIVVAGGVSLLYLLTRPHLTGEQKFVAPMVGLAAGVPIGDLLAIAVGVTVFVKICPFGCSFDKGSTYWLIVTPLSIATDVAVKVA